MAGFCIHRGAGSVAGIVTGYGAGMSEERIPVGARFTAPVQTGPGAHPASCTMGTGSFPVVKSGRGVTLTTHPLLVPWSRKSRSIPLLPLWPVWQVQSVSACTRVHFTLFYVIMYQGKQRLFRRQNYLSRNSKCMCEIWIGLCKLADILRNRSL